MAGKYNFDEDFIIIKRKLLDIMSHKGYPVGSIKFDVNSLRKTVSVKIERIERVDNKTISISEIIEIK